MPTLTPDSALHDDDDDDGNDNDGDDDGENEKSTTMMMLLQIPTCDQFNALHNRLALTLVRCLSQFYFVGIMLVSYIVLLRTINLFLLYPGMSHLNVFALDSQQVLLVNDIV